MATTSAPASWTPRQLWQVPVFLLGLGALGALLLTRPLWHTPAAVARHRLERARRLLQEADADPDRIIALAQAYLDQAGPTADRAGEAHFLIGSAWVRVARASPREAASAWRAAREALEQAQQRGVPEEDEKLLRFRLGLCGFYTSADPQRVASLLAETVEASDDKDKLEGYRVLALAYLGQPTPNLAGALRANEALRQLPLLGEEVLGPARLQAGELLLELRRPAEARRVLRTVSTAAPPEVLARARTLLARTYQDEGGWAEAAALWQEILDDKRRPLKHPGPVLYQLGLCYRHLEQLPEAARAWGECLKRGDGDAVGAAALGLAEVLLAEGNPTALATFERAVRDVRQAKDWKNELVPLPQARAVFEGGVGVCRQRGDFEAALRLARLYERLAEPGRAVLLRGQVAEGWAQILREQPPPGSKAARATQLYREAGDAYLLSAEQATTKAIQAERLWLSAGGYLRAQDAERAMPVLRKFLELGERSDFAGEAWYLLGESERRLRHERQAEAAYRDCLRYPGRFRSRSRFQLSQIELGRGRTDRAVEILEQNITALRRDEPDDEALERSLFAYGALLFRRRDYQGYQQAQAHLEEAVAKFPQSPSAGRGRFELAEACRLLAAEEDRLGERALEKSTKEHHVGKARLLRRKAIEQYTALEPYTSGRAGGPLSLTEQTHVLFSIAECHFNLGEYTTALALYEALAVRYKDRPERLAALGGKARCYGVRKDDVKLQEQLQEIRLALPALDAESRRRWEVWLKDASKQP